MKLIIDNKEIDFNEVYAYIPKLFSELRSDTKWNLYQVKVFTYLLSKLYKHKHKVDKKEFTNQQVESINLDHVPIEYVLSRDDVISITGISRAHFSREIPKVTKGMKKACATVPSLIEPENIKSYRDVSWFESFEYLDTKGLLIAKIDKHILPYLIVFHQYTRIKLSHVLGFKYDYTCDAYIYFKLRLHTKSFNEISINMSIAEFKEKINMTDSYLNSNSMFNKIVLKNLEKEINEATDINFRYELCKTNKKYTSILIYIKNKKTYSNPDAIEVSDHMQAANNKCSLSGDSTTEDTTFISITKLGISVKKAKSIYSQYGEYKTSQAINKLQNEVKKGVVINNAAGYLIGILNNACSNVDSNDISKFQQKKEEESKLSSIEFEENWNSIETHLYKSQEILESLYKILESKDKIYEQVHIECLDQIKMILDINPELLSSLRPFTQVFIKNGTMCVTMPILQQIAHDIKIASDIERLSYFKERLDLKVRKIDLISEPLEKELLLSEIETLKSQLYSLI